MRHINKFNEGKKEEYNKGLNAKKKELMDELSEISKEIRKLEAKQSKIIKDINKIKDDLGE